MYALSLTIHLRSGHIELLLIFFQLKWGCNYFVGDQEMGEIMEGTAPQDYDLSSFGPYDIDQITLCG